MQAAVCKGGAVLCRPQYVKVGCFIQAVVCKGGAVLCRLQYVKVGLFHAGCSM